MKKSGYIFYGGIVVIASVSIVFQKTADIFYPNVYAQGADPLDKEIEEALEEEVTGENESSTSSGREIVDRASLPDISIAVDMTAEFDLTKNDNESETQAVSRNSGNVREAEFGFSTAIDHWALGTVFFAVHNENGQFFVELHEAYFEFNHLPWNLFLKAGKFFLDIGRLNGMHRHDWRFTQAPRVHHKLFDPEGIEDFGGEISILMPWSFYQEVKFGVFNGKKFGHAHDEGVPKLHPLYTGRIKNFIPIIDRLGSQFGLTYLRYSIDKNSDNYWQTLGLDVTFKWQKGKHQAFEWSTEFWYRNTRSALGANTSKYGYYSFVELQLWQIWYFGFRWDHFTLADNFDPRLNENVNKNDYGQSVWVTLKPSEFSYFRITFERQDFYGKKNQHLVLIQADFILGFHPPHRY